MALPESIQRSVEILDGVSRPPRHTYVLGAAVRGDEAGASIDCESRLELCRAACCRMPFPLSEQDVEAGILRWDPKRPFIILHDEKDYCCHIDHSNFRCGVYPHRPLPCRIFDCRNDPRIWLDFENRVVNPALHE